MENENNGNGKTENIFYAALALHVAGKSLNKENIRSVLHAAGTPIDEPSLNIIGAFIESLNVPHENNDSYSDSTIIKLLVTVLSQQNGPTEQLGTLLNKLNRVISPDFGCVTTLGEHNNNHLLESWEQPYKSSNVDRSKTINVDEECTLFKVPTKSSGTICQNNARYVYGITAGGKEVTLGPIGIDGSEVYSVSYEDLSAIIHCCNTKPYQSTDDETIKRWVKTHQSVLDAAKEQFNIIIPLGFDTILKPGNDGTSTDQVVRDWLKNESDHFRAVINQIEGKDEYGIQISYTPSMITKYVPEPSEETIRLKNEIAKKSPGISYIYKQKLEKTIKADMARLADSWFKDFYNRIQKYSVDITVEKTRKLDKGKMMLLNLSCLVAKGKVDSLGEELEKINNMEGFFVHFSGPWLPYSFVNKPIDAAGIEGSYGTH